MNIIFAYSQTLLFTAACSSSVKMLVPQCYDFCYFMLVYFNSNPDFLRIGYILLVVGCMLVGILANDWICKTKHWGRDTEPEDGTIRTFGPHCERECLTKQRNHRSRFMWLRRQEIYHPLHLLCLTIRVRPAMLGRNGWKALNVSLDNLKSRNQSIKRMHSSYMLVRKYLNYKELTRSWHSSPYEKLR